VRTRPSIRVLSSVVLGCLSVGVIAAVGYFVPYSAVRTLFTDVASFPAFLIARIFYPEGVHTGAGVPTWGFVFFIANVLVYSVVWWLVLTGLAWTRRVRLPRSRV
jgi:hypothetical protein